MSLTSDQLKACRALLGWTQDDLAQRINVSPTTVRNWERFPNRPIRATSASLETLNSVLSNAGLALGLHHDGIFISYRFPVDAKKGQTSNIEATQSKAKKRARK